MPPVTEDVPIPVEGAKGNSFKASVLQRERRSTKGALSSAASDEPVRSEAPRTPVDLTGMIEGQVAVVAKLIPFNWYTHWSGSSPCDAVESAIVRVPIGYVNVRMIGERSASRRAASPGASKLAFNQRINAMARPESGTFTCAGR